MGGFYTIITNGWCEFPIPELSLAPEQQAIAAQQVSANFNDCTTVVEIGEPTNTTTRNNQQGGNTATTVDPSQGTTGEIDVQATSSSGYYRVWWEDPVHLRVNEVKKNISWAWDGSCVTSSNGSTDYWWLSDSGWTWWTSASDIERSCGSARAWADSVYENKPFCYPVTVRVLYDDVTAKGHNNGNLSGYVITDVASLS